MRDYHAVTVDKVDEDTDEDTHKDTDKNMTIAGREGSIKWAVRS